MVAPWEVILEIRERPPSSQKTSTVAPLGGAVRDPRAPTINAKNVDSGPPRRQCRKIWEHPPSTQKISTADPPSPRRGSGLHPGPVRCIVNLRGYDRQKVILLTGPTFPVPGPIMADDP
jgi:hypothetical protein